MDASRDDRLACRDLPRERRPRIASTNAPERLNREIRRRADVVGIFPNDEAVVRLVGALMLEADDERTVARRTTTIEAPARVCEAENPGSPAVAASEAPVLARGPALPAPPRRT